MDNNLIQTAPQTTPTAPITQINPPENQEKKDKKLIKVTFKIGLKAMIITVIIIALVLLAYFYKGLLIVAIVDGSPISRLAVIQKLEKDSGKTLLDSLIAEKLIQNEANAKKIVITDDQINEQIKKVEAQLTAQGSTLAAALASQRITMDEFKRRIIIQKEVEAILADKINVTEQEVAQYIRDNKITVPKGQEAATNEQVRTELKNQKLNKEAEALVTDLKAKANIQYFVNY